MGGDDARALIVGSLSSTQGRWPAGTRGMSRVAKHRVQAFIRQHGRCCYCEGFLLPTNARSPLRSTAEHLIAWCFDA